MAKRSRTKVRGRVEDSRMAATLLGMRFDVFETMVYERGADLLLPPNEADSLSRKQKRD